MIRSTGICTRRLHSTVLLAARQHGSLLAWGGADHCQTGSPPEADGATHHGAFAPLGFHDRSDICSVATAAHVSGAISRDGRTYTWGTGSTLGLGVGISSAAEPREIASDRFQSLKFSETAAVAISSGADSQAFVWGVGVDGQLGLGGPMGPRGSYHGGAQETLVTRPRSLQGEPLRATAAARFRTLLLTKDGVLFSSGSGFHGELGVAGVSGVTTAPASVIGLPDAKTDPVESISAGHTFTLAGTASGRLYFWGSIGHGGSPNVIGGCAAAVVPALRTHVPTELPLPSSRGLPLTVAAGLHHAIVTDGMRLWALGTSWATGTVDATFGVAPRLVPLPRGLSRIARITAGPRNVGVIDGQGRAWIAGRLDSPLLLGAETGPSIAAALASGEAKNKKISRAALLASLDMEDEIGADGARDADGLSIVNGAIFSPRLTLVQDAALRGRTIIDLALGHSHALAVVV